MARAGTLLLYWIVLVCAGMEDFRKRKISNGYQGAILLLSLISVVTIPQVSLLSRVFGMLAVSVPMTLLAILCPGSFGGGDVKLAFACGAFLGCSLLVRGTVAAVIFAAIYSVRLLITKRSRQIQFAFGPFLSAGFILVSVEACLFL